MHSHNDRISFLYLYHVFSYYIPSQSQDRRLRLKPGDTLDLSGRSGPVALRVSGIVSSGGEEDGLLFLVTELIDGKTLRDHFYVVDPLGRWMLRAPADPDPKKFQGDLSKLLKASAGWDNPGR